MTWINRTQTTRGEIAFQNYSSRIDSPRGALKMNDPHGAEVHSEITALEAMRVK
ncbi:MAG: hypothetical protein Q8L13_05710 [Bradyrhizobium sp.]|uniref:hypothetical protein n=1 Tax=Bradyrhizobium sp. TaxID=376 RepID=UPI0027306B8E|nr:hypothetical protein [Bradyrhizobium sp.]MDP1865826.1 hypothetical protein [Bradyrhizobium sp.]